MKRKFRYKSEERDRKFSSFIMVLIALVLAICAIVHFGDSIEAFRLGYAVETQVNFILGLVLIAFSVFFIVVVYVWAHHASKQTIVDDDDPDVNFRDGPF